MNGVLQTLGALADSPGDDDETRLRHRILIFAGLLMSCGGLLWGTITMVFGLYWQSMVPYGYVVITALNFALLWRTRNFVVARFVQVTASLVLPFAFQWALGGFLPSGAVMIWAMLCLVGSLTFDDLGSNARWLALYIALTVVSGVLETHLDAPRVIQSETVATVFYVLNMTVVSSVVFGLTVFFVRSRKKAIDELAEKNQQIAASQQALVQSEKLAALGQLVAGVAHELNTPLGAIRASMDNLGSAVEVTMEKLPEVLSTATDSEREGLFALVAAAQKATVLATSREERKARRALRKELEEVSEEHATAWADLLVDMGITSVDDGFLPLLRSPRADELLRVAFAVASLRRNSENIGLAAERSAKIVFALKRYAHPGEEGACTQGDLAENLDTVLTLYHNKMKSGVEVVRRYTTDTGIEALHDQLNQVWTNLIHNAIQAMNYEGRLVVEISPENEGVLVAVVDDGPGIPDEVRARIFEPFYTTKSMGEGSGLGLSICRDIVERHQGTIGVDSRPGHTRFTVWLPRHCQFEEAA